MEQQLLIYSHVAPPSTTISPPNLLDASAATTYVHTALTSTSASAAATAAAGPAQAAPIRVAELVPAGVFWSSEPPFELGAACLLTHPFALTYAHLFSFCDADIRKLAHALMRNQEKSSRCCACVVRV